MAASPSVRAGPTLGVVVPTLDEEATLDALLDALLEGDPADRPERVVVSDGGSRDGTAAVVRAREQVEWICGPQGRGAQLAAGAERLGTEVLCFLHADCVPAAGALRRVRAAFAAGALEACAFHQRVDAGGVFYRAVERCANWRVRRLGWVYGDSGLCVRRGLYEELGGFRDLPVLEDVELSKRLRVRAKPRLIAGAQLSVSARRWQREGALRATLRNWMLLSAYAAGAQPERLARFYDPHGSVSGRRATGRP